eukprot:366438-Chlamydomonas_euryale.AAC.20
MKAFSNVCRKALTIHATTICSSAQECKSNKEEKRLKHDNKMPADRAPMVYHGQAGPAPPSLVLSAQEFQPAHAPHVSLSHEPPSPHLPTTCRQGNESSAGLVSLSI